MRSEFLINQILYFNTFIMSLESLKMDKYSQRYCPSKLGIKTAKANITTYKIVYQLYHCSQVNIWLELLREILLYISGSVNNKWLSFLFDTGAIHHFLFFTALKRLSMKVNYSTYRFLKLANVTLMKCSLYTKKLPIFVTT